MQDRITLVVSDLHMGAGHRKGAVNFFDDFRHDVQVAAFLRRHSTGRYEGQEVELVLNGDIFDLLKVSVDGRFPDRITEEIAVRKLRRSLDGHPKVVRALAAFLAVRHKKITFLPGNHDMEMFYPAAQRMFTGAVAGAPEDPRVRFVTEPSYTIGDAVQIHHGQQFEAVHSFDWPRIFVTDRGERILNLPWGSLFVLDVITRFKAERPYLDKVKPFWPLLAGGLVFDARFTARLLARAGGSVLHSYVSPLWGRRRPFDGLRAFLGSGLEFFGSLDTHARRILKREPGLRVVSMGHVHTETCRSFGRDKLYINTGCWVPMVNLDVQNLGQNTAPHYMLVRWGDRGDPRASLMRWNGPRPIAQEVNY